MHTIFHFNCVICGAHPQERNFDNFEWPSSPQQLVDLISSVKWILPNVEKASWASEPFRQAIDNLLDALLGDTSTPLNAFKGKETIFTRRCPLCDTPLGPRPYDRYFRAWFAWNLLCRVQVGNLLYELSVLFDRNEPLKYLVPFFKKAINQLELPICHCGRPGSDNCRWCQDASSFIGNKEKQDDEEEEELQDEESGVEQEEEFVNFLNAIREDDIFKIGKERWEGLIEALVQDVREQSDVPSRLQNAILAYRFDSIINQIREGLAVEKTWPGEWSMHTVAPTEPFPKGLENVYFAFLDLPREALETIDQFRVTNIPEEISIILESKGLLEYGSPSDVAVYLDRLGIAQVREISNKLGAGKARSKNELIDKILSTAPYEKIAEIIPCLKEKWIKEIKKPFSNLGDEWADYIKLGSNLLRSFLKEKFYSVQVQKMANKNNEELFIQRDYECPSSCKIRAENFAAGETISFNDIPPWFPGCGCSLDHKVMDRIYEEKPLRIGSMVKIEKYDDWATLKPYNIQASVVESMNHKYLLLWQSGLQFNDKFETGYYFVVEDNTIKVLGEIDKPCDGKIANNGTFIISDSRSYSQNGSVIWVLNIQGYVIYRHLYPNHINFVAISEDGKYAACSVGGDCSLQVFDLKAQRIISQFSPEIYYSSIEIDESDQSICIIDDDNWNKIKFNLAGELIDKEAYQNQCIENANGYHLINAVEAFLHHDDKVDYDNFETQMTHTIKASLLKSGKADYQNLETLLRKALEKGVSTSYQGSAYQLLGEIAEAKGNVAQAVTMYTTALQYAPKLPIRKKLKALKESIGS